MLNSHIINTLNEEIGIKTLLILAFNYYVEYYKNIILNHYHLISIIAFNILPINPFHNKT